MADLKIDRRDLDFVLYEQFDLESFTQLERYKEMNRETFDMILSEAIRFSSEELAPANMIADRQGTKLVDGKVQVADALREVYPKFVEGGWMAPVHDPELGGMGLPGPVGLAVAESFLAGCGSFMFFPGLTASAGHLLEVYGAEWLKQLVVPKLYTGEWTGTMCLTEPQAGTAVGDLRSTATPIEGTDRWKISGQKIFISAGDHDLTPNIVHLVLARAPGDPAGTKGISLFAVPKYKFDQDGNVGAPNDVTVTAIEHKMGIHASPTCALSFGDNDDCEGWLIGEQCQGIVYMFQMMNEARIYCGVQGSAMANAAYQLALAYAKERVQGAKVTDRDENAKPVTIIDHPDVRRNLMLCKAWSEGIRALLFESSVYADHARFHPDEEKRGLAQDLLDLLTPICKSYATDFGFKVTELAMQIHGGYGYCSEYGVEQLMRDVKIASIYEGTNGIQALDLLGRKMRLKGGGLFMAWVQNINEFLQPNAEHPVLAAEMKLVDDMKNTLASVAFGFGTAAKADPEKAILGATPFLEMFGHIQVATLLLRQAVIAQEKLEAIYADKGASDAASQKALLREHDDARFYDGKVKTAKFFAHTVLPHAKALARELTGGDRSALDIVF